MTTRYRLGLDIGGTFTDFVLTEVTSGAIHRYKYLTSYPDPADGVIDGLNAFLADLGLSAAQIDEIVHSTTLVTNAVIDRRGARTGLLTSAGFRHVLDLGKEQRYDAYDLFITYPDPLIPDSLRREIPERTLADGEILTPVDLPAVVTAAEDLIGQGIEALAVVFLHAYANPANERAAAQAIAQRFPALPISLSSQVAPVVGEWDRTSTTAADAYVRPLLSRYLSRLQTALAALNFRGRFAVMLSNGGAGSVETARRFPIRLLESGPAAGALAAREVGRVLDLPDLLGFDMGGTTAKACLIEGGMLYLSGNFEAGRVNRFKRGSGLPIAVPSVDLIEIGAGGGSIAWRNDLGLLQVGPHSAAADPGPACYVLGGDQPTVTDANLLLGYLDADFFLGGRMTLDRARAEDAVARLAESLGMDTLACAWGIHQVVNENMAAAARMHIIERGHDPRRFTLVASGGAGPAHVSAVAKLLAAHRFVLPNGAGTLSSVGCLAAPYAFALERTATVRLDALQPEKIAVLFAEMEGEARAVLGDAGIAESDIALARAVDMRMVGQIHTIRVPLDGGDMSHASALTDRFHRLYEQLFARTNHSMPLECVHWHLSAQSSPPRQSFAPLSPAADADPSSAQKGTRPAYFPACAGFVETPVYDRYRLAAGMTILGPAIIEDQESTAVLTPEDSALVDAAGHLLVNFNRQDQNSSTDYTDF